MCECVFKADNKDKDVILEKRSVTVPECRRGVGQCRIVPDGPPRILKAVLCASFLIEFEECSP